MTEKQKSFYLKFQFCQDSNKNTKNERNMSVYRYVWIKEAANDLQYLSEISSFTMKTDYFSHKQVHKSVQGKPTFPHLQLVQSRFSLPLWQHVINSLQASAAAEIVVHTAIHFTLPIPPHLVSTQTFPEMIS